MEARLPAHLEVGGLIRAVEAAGGFATVLHRGEREAGTIMLVLSERGTPAQAYERMPQADGTRRWLPSRAQNPEDPRDFWDWCARRHRQDSDLWVLELDVADGQRFIA
ncbi:DUF1491 family protein [Croceibacterium sp. TMG7-5b_MA50]|uniref:DUF1491 family protein n=1 Tax=Croceibacterium sp. TMG7-5b_MA50 TaxID=3121290 RepID=UPI003222215B